MNSKFSNSYLLWKAKNKDQEAFAKIYEIYIDKIFRFIYFKVSNQDIPLTETVEAVFNEELSVDPTSQTEAVIDKQILEKYLMHLKDDYREILILRYFEEFNISEIAEITNKKKGTVRVTLHRATQALKNLLDKNE